MDNCASCGKDITNRVNWATYCKECVDERQAKRKQKTNVEQYRKNRIIAMGSLCVKCGVFVPIQGKKLRQYCDNCKERRESILTYNHSLGVSRLGPHRRVNVKFEEACVRNELRRLNLR